MKIFGSSCLTNQSHSLQWKHTSTGTKKLFCISALYLCSYCSSKPLTGGLVGLSLRIFHLPGTSKNPVHSRAYSSGKAGLHKPGEQASSFAGRRCENPSAASVCPLGSWDSARMCAQLPCSKQSLVSNNEPQLFYSHPPKLQSTWPR